MIHATPRDIETPDKHVPRSPEEVTYKIVADRIRSASDSLANLSGISLYELVELFGLGLTCETTDRGVFIARLVLPKGVEIAEKFLQRTKTCVTLFALGATAEQAKAALAAHISEKHFFLTSGTRSITIAEILTPKVTHNDHPTFSGNAKKIADFLSDAKNGQMNIVDFADALGLVFRMGNDSVYPDRTSNETSIVMRYQIIPTDGSRGEDLPGGKGNDKQVALLDLAKNLSGATLSIIATDYRGDTQKETSLMVKVPHLLVAEGDYEKLIFC